MNAIVSPQEGFTIYNTDVHTLCFYNTKWNCISTDFVAGTQLIDTRDGNIYKTVQIGTQIWMAENLKATKYNDGTDMPNVTDNTAWNVLTRGAYCDYNNTPSNSGIYGRLYNWHAVNTGKLCPKGWHVPRFDEWNTLINYLIKKGYNFDGTTSQNLIGKSLASKTGWDSQKSLGAPGNNQSINNSSGFSAYPAGCRIDYNSYNSLGSECFFWSYPAIATKLYVFHMSDVYAGISNHTESQSCGFSIRCIKD